MSLPALQYIKYNKPHQLGRKQRVHDVLLMHFNGYKNSEIIEQKGYCASRVSIIINSAYGQAYLNGLRKREETSLIEKKVNVRAVMQDTLEKHIDQLDTILGDDLTSSREKKEIIFSLADRLGHGPMRSVLIDDNRPVGADALNEIQTRLDKERKDAIETAVIHEVADVEV